MDICIYTYMDRGMLFESAFHKKGSVIVHEGDL